MCVRVCPLQTCLSNLCDIHYSDSVFGRGRISHPESDVISENEPLCLFCCVNKSHCVTRAASLVFFFVWFVGCLGLVCKHVSTETTASPWRPVA